MTAAQNTIAFGAPNRFATYAAAVAAGLLVAVIGVAISARPIAEPQSLAKPDRPVIAVSTTIAPNEQADAYFGQLTAKAADPAIIASGEQASAYIDSLNAKAADPAIIASGEQASAYIQFELQRHAGSVGQLMATAAGPVTIASSEQANAYFDMLNAKAADPAIIASGDQASAYIQFELQRHADAVESDRN